MSTHGLFITFEGGEGSGKSTQLRLLANHLRAQGRLVLETREPGGSALAEKIRALLLAPDRGPADCVTEALLFAAARRDHVQQTIRPALAAGHFVLCDRFSDSTMAYQGAGRGGPQPALEAIDRAATEGLRPDVTILLDLSADVGLARAKARRGAEAADPFEKADHAFHNRVRNAFLARAAAEPERFCVLDAAGSAEEVAARVFEALAPRLGFVGGGGA